MHFLGSKKTKPRTLAVTSQSMSVVGTYVKKQLQLFELIFCELGSLQTCGHEHMDMLHVISLASDRIPSFCLFEIHPKKLLAANFTCQESWIFRY